MCPADAPERISRPPIVAIVGRPNVGKSTLFNALAGSRIAIVEDTPGVTRDRIGTLCTVADRTVELVDTGGIGIVDTQGLDDVVEEQIKTAIDMAHAILFVVDARAGMAPLDERVSQWLRRHANKVIMVANKVESARIGWEAGAFAGLGYGDPIQVSAKERLHLGDIEDRLAEVLPDTSHLPARAAPPDMKVALVGRVNAGKSTLVNHFLQSKRMIVSEVPGTTRDSVDLRFQSGDKSLVLIDTAGIRKERSVQGSVDFYAQRRAEKAMRRADVTLLVLDSTTDVSRLDRQIADYALRHYHPIIIVANKWDLAPRGMQAKSFAEYLEKTLPGLRWAPLVCVSAVTGYNLEKILEVAWSLFDQCQQRVATADVNKLIEEAYARRKPKSKQGRIGKIYYGSQVEAMPPTFVLFVNERYLFRPAYLRYLENRFRQHTPMKEVPIRVWLKERERSESKHDPGKSYM